MNVNNELLRVGIISKLKEYDAFIDNELPDYIMVMLANHKTIHQISSDLKLFLGANTERFTVWLQKVITTPDLLVEKEEVRSVTPEQEPHVPEVEETREDSTPPPPPVGTKRRRSEREEVVQDRLSSEKEEDERPSPPKMVKTSTEEYKNDRGISRTQMVKVVVGDDGSQRSKVTGRKTVRTKPEPTRDQDLRELIARRRGEKGMVGRKRVRREREEAGLSGEEGGEPGRATVASVVRLVERPVRSNRGGSRILQRAILGIGGRKGEKLPVKQSLPVTASPQKGPKGAAAVLVKRTRISGARKPTRGSAVTATTMSTVTSDREEGEVEDEVEESFVDEFREEQQQHKEEEEEEKVKEEEEEEEEEKEKGVSEQETAAIVTKRAIPVLVDTERSHTVMGEVVKIEERDLRELLSKSKEDKSTRFVVTLDGVGDQYQHVDTSGDPESEDQLLLGNQDQGEEWEGDTEAVGRGSGMPERCRFWPNCKNGDSCPYRHPSAPCKLFPNCKYGNKCLFIHPQCKFDARCKRADCPYLHTAPRHLMFKQPQVPVPPVVFSPPPFKPPKTYSYSRAGGHQSSLPWQRSSKFPNKSALTWTPKKSSHISERQFAVPKEQSTSLQVT